MPIKYINRNNSSFLPTIKTVNVTGKNKFGMKKLEADPPPTGDFTISPAYLGKTSWDLVTDGDLIFNTSGSWTVTPISAQTRKVKMWGGGGQANYGSWRGGAGGYSYGNVSFELNVPYQIVTSLNSCTRPGANLYGGGLAGLFSGSVTQSKSIMIAGGGGAATDYLGKYGGNGGAGGGSSGQDGGGNGLQNGRGGTQVAGGAAAVYNSISAGTALQYNYTNGDGGAGYWGGGGENAAGAGGGSGYIHPTKVISGSTIVGSNETPAKPGDPSRRGAGQGSKGLSTGSIGIVIITLSGSVDYSGLQRTYYNDYHSDSVGNPGLLCTYADINAGVLVALTSSYSSALFTGSFVPSTTETYTFYLNSDDGAYLWIGSNAANGYTAANSLVNNGGQHAAQEKSGSIALTSGTKYPFRILYGNAGGGGTLVASYSTPTIAKTSDFTGRTYTTID